MPADKGRAVPDHGSGPPSHSRTKQYWRADPDETEGRRLYRGAAEAEARRALARDRYKVRLLRKDAGA